MSSIRLKMFDNCKILLQYMRYVRELKQNSISINMLDG